jgi:C4-dicarboxylate-specific signal transduction histidine kinase
MTNARDVTDESLQALLTAYRYAEVGRCVNSVTHDANNALGVILAYAELVGMDNAVSGEASRMLDEIVDATRRVSDQLSWLTGIARPAKAGKSAVRLGPVIERAVAMRRYDAKRAGVDIEIDVPENLPEVSIEVPAIERAVIYLLANGVEALADCETKRIGIRAEVQDNSVVAYMIDSADPISDDIAQRMFEPFFTTKDAGHLGLGLCAASKAAEANNGSLTYETGQGFCLTLPTSGD